MVEYQKTPICNSPASAQGTDQDPDEATPEVITVAGISEQVLGVDLWDAKGDDWHVIHTKPRQEKALAEALEKQSIRHFLPLVQHVRIYGHRRRKIEMPLFAGYLFLRGSRDVTYTAIETRRVVQVLPVTNQTLLHHELKQIQLALREQGTLDPYPFIIEGHRVRVKAGPFRGMEGIVDARKQQDRIILLVQTIGQATSLEIDASLLEPVEYV